MRPWAWALIQTDGILLKEQFGHTQRRQGCTHKGKTVWGHDRKVATCKPSREASEETKPADTFILDFQPPGKINFCCSSQPVCGILLQPPEETHTPTSTYKVSQVWPSSFLSCWGIFFSWFLSFLTLYCPINPSPPPPPPPPQHTHTRHKPFFCSYIWVTYLTLFLKSPI